MNKNKITFFVLIFALQFSITVKNSFGQWQKCDGFMGGNVFHLTASGNNIFAGTSSGIYLSTNNGVNWTQTATPNNLISLASAGNNIFAGTLFYGVYLSTNNGVSWTQTALNNKNVYSLAVSGNNIFAGTEYYGVYLSTNNGASWAQTLGDEDVLSLAASGNNIFVGTDNGVRSSTNNGTFWTGNFLDNHPVYTLAISGNNIFAGTLYYGVYFSTNNGTSWEPTVSYGGSINSLVSFGDNIFGGTEIYGVYLSTNNGASWIQKNQGFLNGIPRIKVLLITNNYIFAGTGNTSVWRRPLQDIIGIQNISSEIPSAFSLSQNYPNPFNPTTKIKFDVSKTGFTTLKVYDLNGKEVQTLVNEELRSGVYEATFDGGQLTSGVYFYKLSSGEYSETKRMLLVK